MKNITDHLQMHGLKMWLLNKRILQRKLKGRVISVPKHGSVKMCRGNGGSFMLP
jgi:hypothetical protein